MLINLELYRPITIATMRGAFSRCAWFYNQFYKVLNRIRVWFLSFCITIGMVV